MIFRDVKVEEFRKPQDIWGMFGVVHCPTHC